MSKPETGQARTAKSATSKSGEKSDKVVKSAVKSLTKLKTRLEAALAEAVNQREELEIQLNRTSSNKEAVEKLFSDHVTHLHHLLDLHHYRQQEILRQRHKDFLYQLLVTRTEGMNYEGKLAGLHEKVADRLTRVIEHHDVTLAQNANIIPLWNEWNINNTQKTNMQVPRLTCAVETPQLTASEMDALVGRFVFLEDSATAGPLSGASDVTAASTPVVSAKVASTPGVSANVASTPDVSAKVASTPGVSANVASAPGVSATRASTPGVSAKMACTPGVSAKMACTPGVSAKRASKLGLYVNAASTPGVSANVASTPGVSAKMASTPGVSAKVASTPVVSANVASTPGPAKVVSTPGVSAKRASGQGAAHSKRKRTTAQATALLHCQPPANPLKPVWDQAQPPVPPQPDCSRASVPRYLATGGQAPLVKPPSVAAKEVKSVASLLFRDPLERASAKSAPPRQRPQPRPQPRSIAVARGAFPIVLPLRRQQAASIAPRKDGKVWVVHGEDQTLCLDLLDRSGSVLSTTEIAEVPRFVACFEDGPVLVVTSDPQHLVELDSSLQQCGELCLSLSLRVTSVSVGVTGIAVSFKNDLCWISTTGQDDSWIITREKNPKLTGICSTAVMTVDGKELVFAAVRGTQEVAIYQKLSVGAAAGAGTFTALPSFRGRQIERLSPNFMPASISAHDSGFLAVLDSFSGSVAFLNVRKFEMVTVVSGGALCDGPPTLLAFSRGDGEDEPELWVASASGWLWRTTLCFRYDDELGDVGADRPELSGSEAQLALL